MEVATWDTDPAEEERAVLDEAEMAAGRGGDGRDVPSRFRSARMYRVITAFKCGHRLDGDACQVPADARAYSEIESKHVCPDCYHAGLR
jgi:hypothetical protein